MNRQLTLLRHAKSDWDSLSDSDYDRPLSHRGIRDANRVGRWLQEQAYAPDYIVSSPALRARQTIEAVNSVLEIAPQHIHYDSNIYMANRETLLQVLAGIPKKYSSILLVGHNPGLDELLVYLCAGKPEHSKDGKLLTTAAIASLAMPDNWKDLPPHACNLLKLIRPKDL
ncbi:MAG: histidine phosphatase family protein [Gammaproteobacteria bacterium]|nr:histidine phosphatase family protein [Gammaproteobacteria bacterium]